MQPPSEIVILHLFVRDPSGGEVLFKVRRTTPLDKVARAYCELKALPMDTIKFMFEDHRIATGPYGQTPYDLDMEDGDTIFAIVEQLGD